MESEGREPAITSELYAAQTLCGPFCIALNDVEFNTMHQI